MKCLHTDDPRQFVADTVTGLCIGFGMVMLLVEEPGELPADSIGIGLVLLGVLVALAGERKRVLP